MKIRIALFIILDMILLKTNVSTDELSFKQNQLRYSRFRTAIVEKETLLDQMFRTQKAAYPPQNILIRIFKEEKVLELWAQSCQADTFNLITIYTICSTSGKLGPKREQGDLQIPEGFYHIDRFNPASNFYLSLGIDYPNRSDLILGTAKRPGGDIFIHGSCVTIGCVPITDDKIKELYLAAVEAKSNGQNSIPVLIFPKKLDEVGFKDLNNRFRNNPDLIDFWTNLKQGFDLFEKNHKLPKITINQKNGRYQFDLIQNY